MNPRVPWGIAGIISVLLVVATLGPQYGGLTALIALGIGRLAERKQRS